MKQIDFEAIFAGLVFILGAIIFLNMVSCGRELHMKEAMAKCFTQTKSPECWK